MVAYIIEIESLPTFSCKKTDKLIGFRRRTSHFTCPDLTIVNQSNMCKRYSNFPSVAFITRLTHGAVLTFLNRITVAQYHHCKLD